jgi:hypothetical protein
MFVRYGQSWRIVTWQNWRHISIFWSMLCHRRTTMIPRTSAPERYKQFSCPNPQCAQFNRSGEDHIAHRSWTGKNKHIERLRCTVCGCEFSGRAGTLMARSKLPGATLPDATVERLLKCQRWGVCDEGTADTNRATTDSVG